jgi:hypothetical protein
MRQHIGIVLERGARLDEGLAVAQRADQLAEVISAEHGKTHDDATHKPISSRQHGPQDRLMA